MLISARTLASLALLIASSSSLVSAQAPACTPENTCVRREFRSLDADTRTRYFRAMSTLMSNGQYDQYTAWHLQFSDVSHNTPRFLPWHRAMLKHLENALKAIDPTLCLHYWAWEMDSQAAEASPVFAPDAYGSSSTCLQLPWMPTGWRASNPTNHCVRREFTNGGTLGAMASPELMSNLITRTSYEGFRVPFEAGPHATPHVNIGGDMNSMSSPNDPIFYAHHANVDRWWSRWQQTNPSLARTYPGDTSSVLAPFNDYSIEGVFDTSALCYSYEEMTIGTPAAASFLRRRSDDDDKKHHDSKVPHHGVAKFNVTDATDYYSPTDRGNLRALRHLTPAPDAYLEMMKFNITEVRGYESEFNKIIDNLNSIHGYVSPAALGRRRDLVLNLAANSTGFYVDDATKGRIPVSITTSNVNNIVSLVNQAAPGTFVGSPQIRDQVVGVVGPWNGEKSSVGNFERAALEGPKPASTTPTSETTESSDAARVTLSVMGVALSAILATLAGF